MATTGVEEEGGGRRRREEAGETNGRRKEKGGQSHKEINVKCCRGVDTKLQR